MEIVCVSCVVCFAVEHDNTDKGQLSLMINSLYFNIEALGNCIDSTGSGD